MVKQSKTNDPLPNKPSRTDDGDSLSEIPQERVLYPGATVASPKLAEAITAVIAECADKPLAKNERNEFAKYNYVSIDQVLEYIVPIAVKYGLSWCWYEESSDVKQVGPSNCIAYKFVFSMRHSSGEEWRDHTAITIYHPLQGAQTSGSAASYAEKLYCRQMFKLRYGEPDADANAPTFDQPAKPGRKPVTATSAVPMPANFESKSFHDIAFEAKEAANNLESYGSVVRRYLQYQKSVLPDLEDRELYGGMLALLRQGMNFAESDRDKMSLFGFVKDITDELDSRRFDYRAVLKRDMESNNG